MRKLVLVMSVVALGAGSAACASKKYVNTQVGEVNDKVTTLSGTVEETQERTRRNEARIGEVDQKADAAGQRADAAGQRAADARSAADAAASKADELDRASRKLIFEVVLTDDKSRFALGQARLSPEAQTELDRVVEALTADPRNVWIEIEGHTDSTGSATMNEQLGLKRAESVKQYLYEKHNIPLHKMNTISYGPRKPVAPNNTRDGRAQNRRVVVRVLS